MNPIPGSSDPPALLRSFEPGIGRVEPWVDSGPANTTYYHTDLLGTTRMMTDPDGTPAAGYGGSTMPTPATFTAFGERVQGPTDGASNRYGYVGEHGYQSHEEFTWLHLGARYYDPSMGRFLQRDPIGIDGGLNVYLYAAAVPSLYFDPEGQDWKGTLAGGFLWVTGGRDSWLDNPNTVRKVQKGLIATAALCATGAAGLSAAGVNYGVRVGIHGAHHFFPELGRKAVHLQINTWHVGVKGSQWVWRRPLG